MEDGFMSVKERILMIRILEKLQSKPQYGKIFGIEAAQMAVPNGIDRMKKKEN